MAVTTIKKARLGVQDLLRDTEGTSQSFSVPTSNGGTRSVSRINATHIPVTSVVRALKTAANVTLTQTDVDTVIRQLLADNLLQGIPDNVTLATTAGVAAIKALGVGTAQMANDSVTHDKLKDDASVDGNRAVTSDHIRDSAIVAAKIGTGAVIAAKLGASAVEEAKLATGAVTSTKIADYAVKKAKMDFDGSGTSTGNPITYGRVKGTSSVAAATSVAVAATGCTTTSVVTIMGTTAASPAAYVSYITPSADTFTVFWNTTTTQNFSYIVHNATA